VNSEIPSGYFSDSRQIDIQLQIFFAWNLIFIDHGHMERGGHGLLKVSPAPAVQYPSMPCGKVGGRVGRRPAAIFYPLQHPTPYAYAIDEWRRLFSLRHVIASLAIFLSSSTAAVVSQPPLTITCPLHKVNSMIRATMLKKILLLDSNLNHQIRLKGGLKGLAA
jgi:hypothetical protein